MPQTKPDGSHVDGFRRNDGRVYLYDLAAPEAWIEAHEGDFVEVTA
jgi:hypothetical protein